MSDHVTPSASGGVSASGLAKRFGDRRVLAGVSVECPPGRTLAVVGANGSGKSTLLRILAGVLTPDAGTATVAGAPAGRGRCALVQPAGRGLHPRLSARHNIEFFARLAGSPQTRAQAERAADATGAAHLLDRPVATLSAGEARRVAIAAGFVTRAPVVCIDEPFEHLDEAGRDAVRALASSWTQAGGSVVFAFPHLSDGPACDVTLTIEATR